MSGGLSPEDDRQLMLSVAQDDARAFERLYRAYWPQIRAFLARRGGYAADDLAQEVFVRAWQYRHCYRGESSAKTYLMGIAQNILREARRSARRETHRLHLELDLLAAPTDQPALPDPMLTASLEQAKASLSARQLQALELVYYLQIKPAQAAVLAGCTYKAMRRRLEKARSHLRQILGPLLKT